MIKEDRRLYHGTAAKYLGRIQAEGLQPRAKTKVKGNWTHSVDSNRKAIYLTDAYAWHFAAAASDQEKGLIVELDKTLLLPWLLCPDEDWLEQGSRRVGPTKENPTLAPTDWDMKRRTKHYRKIAEFNPKLAPASLEGIGTAAYYGRIPWSAVTRYVTIDWKKLDSSLYMQAVDSMVSILNYQILAERHRALTKWFFGDPVTAAEVAGNQHWLEGMERKPENEKVFKTMEAQNERWAEAMQKRDGLTVVNVKEDKLREGKIIQAHTG